MRALGLRCGMSFVHIPRDIPRRVRTSRIPTNPRERRYVLRVEHASPAPALFVATDLERFETTDPDAYAADVAISGRCYRRLDPPYYAWLRRSMALAKKALDAGRLAATVFETLRAKFNEIHAWAVARFGEAALLAAAKAFDPKTYVPPRADDDDIAGSRVPVAPSGPTGFHFPARGAWPCTEPVAADAIAKIDAIRENALALGWSEAALYQNRGHLRFPVGDEYGLVCFLGDDATIESVARDAVTIRHVRGNALRFHNPDVEPPWRRAAQIGAA